jgi:peptidylprolyl isomerase
MMASLAGRLAALSILAPGALIAAPTPPLSEILAKAPAGDWRTIPAENLLVMTLPKGRVVIELAPAFAPNHVVNLRRLAKAHFFDGLFVVRVQDDYVTQWGDADAKRPLGEASRTLAAEFDRAIAPDLPFDPLPDPDTYAPQTGFSGGFPAARDPATGRTWLVHCYGMVGAGRDNDENSGGGPELYAVIGQAPRQLDRNVTLLGRVVEGMEFLSSLPRGHGELGFYEKPDMRTPISSVTLAADLPSDQRPRLQALRTDSATFASVVQGRRFRQDAWYKRPAGHIDVCNVPLPVRPAAASSAPSPSR